MATAAKVYLILYPKPALAVVLSQKPELNRSVWQALSEISDETLIGEGRVFGGGLHKLEPKELGNAICASPLGVYYATLNCDYPRGTIITLVNRQSQIYLLTAVFT